ncbi:MAG: hypothetical protein ACK4VN_01400 [Bacteroidales bacterium]
MNKIYILLLISLCGFSSLRAQQQETEKRNNAISLVSVQPFFLTANGLRIDFDRKVDKKNWVVISPIVYLRDNNSNSDAFSGANFKTHRGVGLHLSHRFYPGGITFGHSPYYISYGFVWHYHDLQYNHRELGVSSEGRTMINRWGGEVTIGLMAFTSGIAHVDLYTGLGIRHADFRFSGNGEKRFNNNYWDPGYSGSIMLLGIRLGIATGHRR